MECIRGKLKNIWQKIIDKLIARMLRLKQVTRNKGGFFDDSAYCVFCYERCNRQNILFSFLSLVSNMKINSGYS